MKMNNKAQVLENLGAMAIAVAGLAITIVITLLILSQARTQAGQQEGLNYAVPSNCTVSQTCNATGTLVNAVASIPGWVPLVVIAVIGSVLLGLVAMFRNSAQ